MKAKQLKRIIDFINLHHPRQTSSSIRALLKSNPEQFINLLNKTVEQSDTVPNSVVNFIKEVSKQVQQTKYPQQEPLTKENSTMKSQNKTSIIMRLTDIVKGAWTKAVQLLTNNTGKVKLVVSAIAVAVVAVITSKGTAILAVLAALKSKGLIQSVVTLFTRGLNRINKLKSGVISKLAVALDLVKMGGLVMLDKLNNLKEFIVQKAKQAWSWVVELFTTADASNTHQQAA